MAHHSFVPKEVIIFAWHTVKKKLLFFAGIYLVVFLASNFPSLFESILDKNENMAPLKAVLDIISWILSAGIYLGLLSLMLKAVDKKQYRFDDIFSQFKPALIVKYFFTLVLYFIAIVAGLVLLVVPGIYLAIRFSLAYYILFEKNVSPIEALKLSWKMTEGNVLKLLAYGIWSIGVSLLGFLAFGVGLLVAQPVVQLGFAYIYRKLSAK